MNNKHIFECKGPMGSGLALNQTGRHVAYSAGTGVLVFLDLVAYLIIRIVDKHCNLGINSAHNAASQAHNNTTAGADQSFDNPYAGGNKANGGALNHSERTKGASMGSSQSMSNASKFGKAEKIHGSAAPLDLDNFQFDLHTSFASEPEAMGLDVIDLLTELC